MRIGLKRVTIGVAWGLVPALARSHGGQYQNGYEALVRHCGSVKMRSASTKYAVASASTQPTCIVGYL